MTHYRSVHLLQAVMLCGLAALPAVAQTAADNTKVNARDRGAGAVTADQQKETAADRDLTKRIRQSVIGDKSLSLYAHNVKIVTRGGQVTLKGPVNSEAEKQAIEKKATAAAGARRVTNDKSKAAPAAPKTTNK
jgi:osmotically-inducible protein OsmY